MAEQPAKKTRRGKKIPAKKPMQIKQLLLAETRAERYIEGIGGRKTASARVRVYPDRPPSFHVNTKDLNEYFQDPDLQNIASEPMQKLQVGMEVQAQVRGGGIRAQAEAVRHGIARALAEWKSDLKEQLRSFGYLTRDPRVRERKKFGLRRARRARQWRKR